MGDKISDNFLGTSRSIMEEHPDLKENLEKVMGKVADSLVRKKYVESEKEQEKTCANPEKKS